MSVPGGFSAYAFGTSCTSLSLALRFNMKLERESVHSTYLYLPSSKTNIWPSDKNTTALNAVATLDTNCVPCAWGLPESVRSSESVLLADQPRAPTVLGLVREQICEHGVCWMLKVIDVFGKAKNVPAFNCEGPVLVEVWIVCNSRVSI